MALTSTKFGLTVKDDMAYDDDVDATAEQNLTGGSGTLYSLTVQFTTDGSDGELVWFKMADSQSVTVGTTPPDVQFPVDEGIFVTVTMVDGFALSNGLSMWGTTSALVGSSANPDDQVKAWVVFR
tara:strand:+ start:807 stop:1181 length:375 start_codon:yes stop_codon:yes gene_type:complete